MIINKARSYLKKALEYVTIGLLLSTILIVFNNVVMRYVFNNGLIGLQELEWHLFSSLFLLGMSYALLQDAHVRVDIFYQNYNILKKKYCQFFRYYLINFSYWFVSCLLRN